MPTHLLSATALSRLYRTRWRIEGLFGRLKSVPTGEVRTLGTHDASLLAFCSAAIAYDVLALLQATVEAEHPICQGVPISTFDIANGDLARACARIRRSRLSQRVAGESSAILGTEPLNSHARPLARSLLLGGRRARDGARERAAPRSCRIIPRSSGGRMLSGAKWNRAGCFDTRRLVSHAYWRNHVSAFAWSRYGSHFARACVLALRQCRPSRRRPRGFGGG